MEQKKEEIDEYFTKLVRFLNKKEKYRYHDRDDLDYYWVRDIESLFSDVYDYYKPILVKTAFKEDEEDESGYSIGYKLYESGGDKDKISSAEQYLVKIKPYLRDLINEHKTPESGEWKIQLNIHTCLFLLRVLEKLAMLIYWVIMKKLCELMKLKMSLMIFLYL